MKKFYLNSTLLLVILFLLINPSVNAQNVAWNNMRANGQLKKGNAAKAIFHFNKSLSKDSTNYKANIGLARTYLYSYQLYDSSTVYLERGMRHQKKDTNYIHFYDLANSLRLSHRPDEAIQFYELFKKNYVEAKNLDNKELNDEIDKNINYCRNSAEKLANPQTEITVQNMDFYINSRESEYTPVYIESDSSLMYNARYKDLKNEKQFADYQYMENVYYFDLEELSAATFDESVKQASHRAVVGKNFGSDTIMLFYQNKLWVGSTFEKRLSEQQPLPENLSKFYFQPHGVFSRDNKSFYFSAMKTEEDNLDIYESHKNGDGTWTDPVKVKGQINTEFREDSPFLTADGQTMYFSSKGHNSTGGYDIYKSQLIDGEWSKPEALPYPINSAGDDIYYTLDESEKFGYLSSNRIGGFGLMDIYTVLLTPIPTFDCPQFENPELLVHLDISESVDTSSVDVIYTWHFEDGTKVIGLEQEKLFNSPGTHQIKIDITDVTGGQTELAEIIEEIVIDSVDYIGFKNNRNYVVGDTAHLDASVSYLEDVSFTNYFWAIDDSILSIDQTTLDIPLNKTGEVVVSLQVYGKQGVDQVSFCRTDTLFVRNISDSDTTNGTSDTTLIVNNNNNGNDSNKDTTGFINSDSLNVLIDNNTIIEDSDIKPIYFAFDKADLTSKSIAELDRIVTYLGKYPSVKLIISGHTDAMGSEEYNKLLSQKRINSTIAYLNSRGINSNRIVKTVSHGESKPAVPNAKPDGSDNFNGRKLNRRVEFTVIKK